MAQLVQPAYLTKYDRLISAGATEKTHETGSPKSDSEAEQSVDKVKELSQSQEQMRTLFPPISLAAHAIHSRCGRGSYGKVYEASFSGDVVAIKIIESTDDIDIWEKALAELKMLHASKGLPNVLQIKGWGNSVSPYKYFFTTDLLESIPENTLLNLDRVRKIAKGIFTGLKELHRINIIHGDVKPGNCLMNAEGEGVIADLGSATYKNEKRPWPLQTANFRDPRDFIKAPYDQTVDLWGLGCTLSEFAMGRPLFLGGSFEHFINHDYHVELHTLHLIVQLLGMPSTELLRSGKKSHHYFQPQGLKELPDEYTRIKQKPYNFTELNQVTSNNFAALIGRLVTYGEKISAEDALQSPFFTE